MYTVDLVQLIEKMNLENLTPDIDIKRIKITQPDVNRPALQLAGFFDHFDSERVQVIGYVEHAYMQTLAEEKRLEIVSRLLDYKVPCIVFCRNLEVSDKFIKLATEKEVPILRSSKTTSSFMAEVIRWLNVELAPRITIHGVLVDVYGEGILIMGESGIGKSEAALELIKRGHRLVADDVVEIKKVSDETLIGTATEITRHFIELRGIGIVDVKTLFGVESVKNTQAIDLVIKLEEWNKDKEYDRMGLEEQYIEFLGNKVVCHSIPIRPGRNLAIICETAAVNHRQKKMGYNAAQEIYKRVTHKIQKNSQKRVM
ncbi:Hpr(Ser) kinase/phosphatase [Herbinix hemicellulosilytica]|uniref:HPr kinase/phosphorylase n=2 Tax=Herbinix hemicellulosilytica TaxID=1564487 RepID=A0A0H5SXU5_HERHM|nr:HPr(Ser) kinase/phosphatase [Herbinix hemicellulosilytica]RBP59795.1 Hpr(Ser) kinase/phosphatase [Herbinix hemicellulosilytica]CRZ35183.1 HPr kinase/phosphorylase [Herbinix hemicellulosilytica]HPU62676.1 HPr(Ser) kinase/phosphatase [Mobilitalea sp.]